MVFSKFFKVNKKKEKNISKRREISLKPSLNTSFLEKMPIHLILINKNKIIKQFNSLAKEEFGLKIGYNLTHIIRNPNFVKNINVAVTRNVKRFFVLESI